MLNGQWTSLPQPMFDEILKQNEAELKAQESERKLRFKEVLEHVGESRSDMFTRKYGRLCWQAEADTAIRLDIVQDEDIEVVTGIPYQIDAKTITLKPHLPENDTAWVHEPYVVHLENILGQTPLALSTKIVRDVHPQYISWANAGQRTA